MKTRTLFGSLCCLCGMALGMKPMESCKTGSITYYSPYNTGSCGYGDLKGETGPGYTTCAALNKDMLNGAEKCGVCYEIVGPLGATRVMITDRCPGATHCGGPMTHFDLTGSDTFALVQDIKAGVSNVTYRMVSCDVKGNIKAKITDDSTQYWASFMFFNHRTQLSKVEYKNNGAWTEIERQSHNHYQISSPPVPFNVRLTSIAGDSIEYTFNTIDAGKIIDLGGQFKDIDWEYGGASKDCCSAPNNWVNIVGEGIEGIWKDWSYSTTTSVVTTSPHSGSSCLKADITKAWGGLQLGSNIGPSTTEFTGFEFYLKRDSATPASATLTLSFVNIGPSQTLRDIPTTWTKYTFNSSELVETAGKISTICFQSSVAGAYYFDDMSFVLPDGGLTKTCASGVDHGESGSGSGGGKSSASALTFQISTLLFVLLLSILF